MAQTLPPIGAEVPQPGFGLRADGSQKGNGFLGVLTRPDGKVSSEISIGVNIDGKEVEIPALVPTLTPQEKQWLLTNDVSDPSKLPKSIIQKAVAFARPRLAAGQSPFAQANESPVLPRGLPPMGAEVAPRTPDFHLDVKADPDQLAKLNQLLASVGGGAEGIARGAAKGVGNTVFGLGKIFRDYTPVGRISDAIVPPIDGTSVFSNRPPEVTPQGGAEHLGFSAEQLAEFFLPTGAGSKLARVAEMAKSGLLTGAQGGTGTDAGISAAITGLMPGGSVVKKAEEALRAGAEKNVAQALGATKEWAKTEAKTLAPEMLARGVRGSRPAMLEQAAAKVAAVGKQIGAEVDAAAKAGKTIDGARVASAIQQAKQGLLVTRANGSAMPIEGAQAAVKKLDRLEKFVGQLGPDIPFDKAQTVKQAWDRIVSKAGLYGPKATSSATDNANAWAIREAAGSFRDLLAQGSPTLETLNKEYGFWKGMKNVLTETEKRTQAQGGGLTAGITGAVGVGAGFASGEDMGDRIQNAVIGGAAGRQLVKVMQSPYWRTAVSARAKTLLAEALAKGDPAHIARVVGQITAAIPVQAHQALAQ